MTFQATLLSDRVQTKYGVLVTCTYLHVESSLTKDFQFVFPSGMDYQASCVSLIPQVEVLLTQQEKDKWLKKVRDEGNTRADVEAGVVLNTANQVHKYILADVLAADGMTAASYDQYLQDFIDAELVQSGLVEDDPTAAQWKSNSATNKVSFDSVSGYNPLA